MTNNTTPSIYESLASILLPDGILDFFEVIRVEEDNTGKPDEKGLEIRIIHIYLDERDLR